MKRAIIISFLLAVAFFAQAQTVVTVRMTRAQVADAVNANLRELFDYADPTLYSSFDTLTDTHASYELVMLREPLDSLAEVFGITLSDSLYFGQTGARYRLALNTMFAELYAYMNSQSGGTYAIYTRAGEAILTRNSKYIITR